jgi:hypothetical protein
MKILKKLIGTIALSMPVIAFSAVPADVTTALATASTDGVTIAGVVLGVIVSIAAFKYIRRAL